MDGVKVLKRAVLCIRSTNVVREIYGINFNIQDNFA